MAFDPPSANEAAISPHPDTTDCRAPRLDGLTGLPSPWWDDAHLHLEDAFPPAARPKPGDAFLRMDLVAFIYVNDHWGHVHGDEVLRSVAGIISRAAGERPVWRCGGDEFLVMSTGGAAPALALATAIRDAIRDLGEASPGRPMDVRIGIAVAGAFDTAETLYRRADAAMVIADGRDARIALS